MIKILQREPTWLAAEKPAGLPTQAAQGVDSLEIQLRAQLADSVEYLAMPHRLDVPVGGVILVATTKKAARLLSEQFAARKIDKTYHAVVAGDASGIERCWKDRIRKIADHPKVEIADETASDAKSAVTRVENVDYDAAGDRTRLILKPETGRMHQLRIGSASRGFPILGDSLYGDSAGEIQLRAVSIEFHDPSNGKRTRVDASELSWCPSSGLSK
ncbi:Ribosomal large subunit pseudouridine synthase A [Rubripirellula obstinata]|uniref:Ribosomal large subunit pseudouridine synthase A n=1 Tax=Rubripirellula obstinata TaxID=406547 RepID=A0A5B1CHS8_9BACT|nr:RluA family pseudouridine synthase [Rubripirellula obstinata]KAA1259772.1 Ribosomal large subunit pseudouridine synthase A [Rubripirellula obstinata]